MIIEKTAKSIENGINKILEEIENLENFSNSTAVGAVRGQLDTLNRIEVLKDALSYLDINSYECKGNKIKIKQV